MITLYELTQDVLERVDKKGKELKMYVNTTELDKYVIGRMLSKYRNELNENVFLKITDNETKYLDEYNTILDKDDYVFVDEMVEEFVKAHQKEFDDYDCRDVVGAIFKERREQELNKIKEEYGKHTTRPMTWLDILKRFGICNSYVYGITRMEGMERETELVKIIQNISNDKKKRYSFFMNLLKKRPTANTGLSADGEDVFADSLMVDFMEKNIPAYQSFSVKRMLKKK